MKELYTKPELKLEKFNTVDVLTESETTEAPGIGVIEDGD